METSYIMTMSNFPILVKMPLIFPIPWAPAPFPKRGVRALIRMDCAISIRYHIGTILHRNYRKMTILCYGHFPIIPLLNFMVSKFGSHNMTVFYQIRNIMNREHCILLLLMLYILVTNFSVMLKRFSGLNLY